MTSLIGFIGRRIFKPDSQTLDRMLIGCLITSRAVFSGPALNQEPPV